MAHVQWEHMITVTLSPQLQQCTAKQQLKQSYKHVKSMFRSGMGCFEFTKQGNIHYHIKTQDSIDIVYDSVNSLKTIQFKSNGKNNRVFGFTKIDATGQESQRGNYEYLQKDIEQTYSIMRRMKLTEYHQLWDYSEIHQRVSGPAARKSKIDLRDLITIDSDSDTELMIKGI